MELAQNEWALIMDDLDPSLNHYVFGPQLYTLQNAWERVADRGSCTVLDSDDYIFVTKGDGSKISVKGPLKYEPQIGDVASPIMQALSVPVNNYIIINDANEPLRPIHHLPGPMKFYLEPFQNLIKNGQGDFWPMIEVTANKAVHLQRSNGNVEMLSDPQFYMPEVGERVLAVVTKQLMQNTDFCILKGPDGTIKLKNGSNPLERAFFLEPFHNYVKFKLNGKDTTILSTLLQVLNHTFEVRTNDNVVLKIDAVINFQITDVSKFSEKPIDFDSYVRISVQNELLAWSAQKTVREFQATYSQIAADTNDRCLLRFSPFGITIQNIQVQFQCADAKIHALLQTFAQTKVTKSTELAQRKADIAQQRQMNETERVKKEQDVANAQARNNQIIATAKMQNEQQVRDKINEQNIRLKEMETEIATETKRAELLKVRRGNDLLEAEYRGRVKGAVLREFLSGIDEKLTAEQKLFVWKKKLDLEQSILLYDKVDSISMYPPRADLKLFNFADGTARDGKAVFKSGMYTGMGLHEASQ